MTAPPTAVVELDDRAFHALPSYGWVDVKRFSVVPADAVPSEVLRSLLAHDRFRDSYATATSHEDGGELHGPYELAAVGTTSYEAVGLAEVVETLFTFAALCCNADEAAAQRRLIGAEVLPHIEEATAFFRLRDLGAAARHEWGWVLEHFTEVVAVDERRGTVTLVVAAED